MTQTIIFGNSGSGKTTLAKHLAAEQAIAHMDLDTIAWEATATPVRCALCDSRQQIEAFLAINQRWVIEGCYADLIQMVIPKASRVIFLNLPVEVCVENARSRPWEPHKYESKQAQDNNLSMLIDWIKQYPERTDTFSRTAHQQLYEQFAGEKIMYTSNIESKL